jgi:hypothetical protein
MPSADPSGGVPSSAVPGATATAISPSTAAPTGTPSRTVGPTPASTGRWEGAGTLVYARRDPTAVVLGESRVLVVGDAGGKYEGPPAISRMAEIWDPRTGTWRETESLPSARDDFGAVALLDGRALIAGGWNGSFVSFSSAYVYDGGAGTWTKTGLMGTARAAPAIAVLRDGRVLIAGGAYCSGVRPMRAAIELAAYRVTGAGGGVGGVRLADMWPGPDCRDLATAELFDPATSRWTATGPMRYAGAASAVTLTDGRVLVAGAHLEVYDPDSGRFSTLQLPPPPDPAALTGLGVPSGVVGRASLSDLGTLMALPDGDALLVGATWDASDGASQYSIIRTLRFAPATSRWTDIGAPGVEYSHEVNNEDWVTERLGSHHPDGIIVGLPDSRVLAAGGFEEGQLGSRNAELLDVASSSWTSLPPMPGARERAAAVALPDGSALVIGGYSNPYDGYPVELADVFRFVPTMP